MKHALIFFLLSFNSVLLFSQVVLTIEGTEVNDTETGSWAGVVIPNSQPTKLTFRNNSITSVNAAGYMLCAGDEVPGLNNNHLDGAIITGNKLNWNGTDEASTTHALFTGYNMDVVIKYNYLYQTPNGIQRKSNGMTDISGVIAYNIINNPVVGIVVKGMNGVRIFNNTLYSERTLAQTSRGLIDIHTNTDGGLYALSTGTKVFNNIFYTKSRTINIKIFEAECLSGFESDYNLFWCEEGEPIFEIGGQTRTFTQWQALGYDQHSVVMDPDFINYTDFVPQTRLDYGKDLGPDLEAGLAVDAGWGKTDPQTVSQVAVWQVGARLYGSSNNGTGIYPNPAYGYFYVSNTDTDFIYQSIKIYDAAGRIVMADPLEFGRHRISVPENFPSGLYNVALEADNLERKVIKLVILN
jgi:hypothetical protein